MIISSVVLPGIDKGLCVRPENEGNGNDQQNQLQVDFIALIVWMHDFQAASVTLHHIFREISSKANIEFSLCWDREKLGRLFGKLRNVEAITINKLPFNWQDWDEKEKLMSIAVAPDCSCPVNSFNPWRTVTGQYTTIIDPLVSFNSSWGCLWDLVLNYWNYVPEHCLFV